MAEIRTTFEDQPGNSFMVQERIFFITDQKIKSVCPGVTLVCDSVAASKGKCGFNGYGGSATLYLTRVTVTTGNISFTDSSGTDTASFTRTVTESITFSEHGDCEAPDISCEGTGSITSSRGGPTCVAALPFSFDPCVSVCRVGPGGPDGPCWVNFLATGDCGSSVPVTCEPAELTETTYKQYCHFDHEGIPINTGHLEITVSDPYTTDLLKTNTATALPSYSGIYGCPKGARGTGQNCSCVALSHLNTAENVYTIQRDKYKFLIDPPACEGMFITWQTRFRPYLSDGTIDPNSAHYVLTDFQWPGGGDEAVGGETETNVFTQTNPATNGKVDIINIQVDCTDCSPDALPRPH